ncbi:2-amino-3-carboxymuconate-6-semialdehyde decarboxylase [Klebsiella aerogenes]|nr:2-amino-3-carboxymuconate-6-semialdehyde decarboxylase [Klebsiella aerogenes]
MRGKIALEEHVSTPENNRLWDSSGEAGRNGTEYMKDVERRLLDRSIQLEEMAQRHIDHVILSLTSPGAQSILDKAKAVSLPAIPTILSLRIMLSQIRTNSAPSPPWHCRTRKPRRKSWSAP